MVITECKENKSSREEIRRMKAFMRVSILWIVLVITVRLRAFFMR